MKMIVETEAYAKWFEGLRDARAKARINIRLERVETGQYGDHKSVGDGVFELRFAFGPGYRVYFAERGVEVILLLAGGDKDSQERDIAKAKEVARNLPKGESHG
jgi:putative addiction module killer protein